MRWTTRKIMSDYLDQARYRSIQVGEMNGKLEDEVRFNIHVNNEKEVPESLDNLTDDDVFKELISIVVDVFSHKSENCMLTFELPSQSDGFATTFSSDSSCCASASDCFVNDKDKGGVLTKVKSCESVPSRKSSKHERNLKLPINKPSKHNHKKKLDKLLNPIVQTVLHAKHGISDFETLFKLRQQSGYRRCWQEYSENDRFRTIRISEEQKNVENEWENKKEVTWDLVMKPEDGPSAESSSAQNCCTEDIKDIRSTPYSQLHETIDTLQMLMNTNDVHSLPDTHRIENHIAEIISHVSAIRGYLFPELSNQSSSWKVNNVIPYPKIEKVGAFVSRSRKKRGYDVTLYRIASKKSFEIRRCNLQRKNRNKHKSKNGNKAKLVHQENEDAAGMNLKNVLHNYQRVKREETELVKVILNQLGLRNNKEKIQSNRQMYTEYRKGRRMSSRYCQTSDNSHMSVCSTIQDYKTLDHQTINDVEPNKESWVDNAAVKQEIDKKVYTTIVNGPFRTLRRGNRRINSLSRRFEINRERKGKSNFRKCHGMCIKKKRDEISGKCKEKGKPFKSCSQISEAGDRVLIEDERGERAVTSKEDKVMSLILKATERLEHMKDFVEKKLDYLCQQKELIEEIKLSESTGETEESKFDDQALKTHEDLALKPKGISSEGPSSESRNTTPDASTKTCQSCLRYTNDVLEESKDFKELLKGFEASGEVANSKYKGNKEHFKVEQKSLEDTFSMGKTHSYSKVGMRGEMEFDHGDGTHQMILGSEVANKILLYGRENLDVPDSGDINHENLQDNIKEEKSEFPKSGLYQRLYRKISGSGETGLCLDPSPARSALGQLEKTGFLLSLLQSRLVTIDC